MRGKVDGERRGGVWPRDGRIVDVGQSRCEARWKAREGRKGVSVLWTRSYIRADGKTLILSGPQVGSLPTQLISPGGEEAGAAAEAEAG